MKTKLRKLTALVLAVTLSIPAGMAGAVETKAATASATLIEQYIDYVDLYSECKIYCEKDNDLSLSYLNSKQEIDDCFKFVEIEPQVVDGIERRVFYAKYNYSDVSEEFSEDMKKYAENMKKLGKFAGLGSDFQFYPFEDIDSITVKYRLPFTVVESNGDIEDDTITFEDVMLTSSEAMFATGFEIDQEAKVTISGVKNKAVYNKPVNIRLGWTGTKNNLITHWELTRKANKSSDSLESLVGTSQIELETSSKARSIQVTESGIYELEVVTITGTKKVKFTVDRTAPKVTGVANNKTYKGKVKVSVKDNVSGISKITLNGKKIKSGAKITKKGSYTLKAKDKAGNVKTIRFKIM